jgi:hypothetical protein
MRVQKFQKTSCLHLQRARRVLPRKVLLVGGKRDWWSTREEIAQDRI